jgi:hypothetical protein
MKVKAIKKAAEKISKKYGVENFLVITPIKGACGDNQVEIRSELTLDEGGAELSEAINKIDKDYICEAAGGCVYIVYKPL